MIPITFKIPTSSYFEGKAFDEETALLLKLLTIYITFLAQKGQKIVKMYHDYLGTLKIEALVSRYVVVSRHCLMAAIEAH